MTDDALHDSAEVSGDLASGADAATRAAKQQLDGAREIRIPAEVRHRGLLGTRELSPGMLAAVVLADPAVRQYFEATAQAHGVEIRPADDDVMADADHRAKLKP